MIVNLMKEDFQICIEWKCAVFTRSKKKFWNPNYKKIFLFLYLKNDKVISILYLP